MTEQTYKIISDNEQTYVLSVKGMNGLLLSGGNVIGTITQMVDNWREVLSDPQEVQAVTISGQGEFSVVLSRRPISFSDFILRSQECIDINKKYGASSEERNKVSKRTIEDGYGNLYMSSPDLVAGVKAYVEMLKRAGADDIQEIDPSDDKGRGPRR